MDERKISRRNFLASGLAAGLSAVLLNVRAPFARTAAESPIPNRAKSSPMEVGRPSRTALSAATHRAAHQFLDVPKVFDDPLALRIICENAKKGIWVDLCQLQKKRSLRAFIALRSRYAEDELALAIQRGVRQYVILGAGLDTFGYRNPYPASRLRVFEVDLPATQTWKRVRLREAEITIPDSLTFAPVDFEQQTLADGLNRAGFRADEPAFFSMLGVVVYLTKSAVMETFKFVASLPAGSEIVFDYGILSSMLSERQRSAREYLARRVADIGEPWITYFDPASLARDLRAMGFKQVDDLGPEAAKERYFKDRTDGLRISGSARLMKART
ncbi:MAG: class I SAM-dependent methyltransferase [Pseudomonadota bacterium]